MKPYNILIAGFGNIGKHLYTEFTGNAFISNPTITSYDYVYTYIYDKIYKKSDIEYHNSIVDKGTDKEFDFMFISVPTEKIDTNDEFSTLSIDAIIDVLNANFKVKEAVIIKSTVPIGTMDKLVKEYKNYNFVYSPEYYGTTIHSPNSPNFLVLSGSNENTGKVANLYHRVKDRSFRITFTEDFRIAETAKYMENAFLAYKVSFCAEFYKLSKTLGFDYNKLREIFILDERMGDSHTYIDPEQPYWESHCLDKDVPALIHDCNNLGIDIPIIKAMYSENMRIRKESKRQSKYSNFLKNNN